MATSTMRLDGQDNTHADIYATMSAVPTTGAAECLKNTLLTSQGQNERGSKLEKTAL